MRLRHIEVFNAIYSLGSVSGAARFLNVTQPTASKVLKNAEHYLGYPLFSRIDGKLIATPEADILYQKTSFINKHLIELDSLAKNLKQSGTGKISIASVPAIGIEFLPRAIEAYRQQYPEAQFEIQLHQTKDVVQALYDHEKNIGITFDDQPIAGTKQMELVCGRYVCVGAPNLFGDKEQVTLADISEQRLISIENSGPLADVFRRAHQLDVFQAESEISAQTYLVAKNLAALGNGVAIMDEFSAQTTAYGQVDIKPLTPQLNYRVIALTLEQKALSVEAKRFLEFLSEFLQQHTFSQQ